MPFSPTEAAFEGFRIVRRHPLAIVFWGLAYIVFFVALFALVHGFKTGTFTGRKITDYINRSETDFVNARRCINGTDKATEIAERYGFSFYDSVIVASALLAGCRPMAPARASSCSPIGLSTRSTVSAASAGWM